MSPEDVRLNELWFRLCRRAQISLSAELHVGLASIHVAIAQSEKRIMASAQDIKDALADQKAENSKLTAAVAANAAATTGLSTVVAALVAKVTELRNSGGATPSELDGILAEVQASTATATEATTAVAADTAAESAAAAAGTV